MGLLFFRIASRRIYLGFVLEIVLITQGCFQTAEPCLHRAKAFSAPYPTSPPMRLGSKKFRRTHIWDTWSQLNQGIFQPMWRHAQPAELAKEEEREGLSEWWCLSSQVTSMMKYFPGDGWRPVCQWEAENEIFIFHFLFSLLNCIYFNLWVFWLLS